jgi:hypothetical protein
MKRLAVILFAGALAGLAGCGGQDSGTELPSIDAAKESAAEAGTALSEAAGEAEASADAKVEELAGSVSGDAQSADCLALVAGGEFTEAVSVCTAALAADPANQQLQRALDSANAGAGQLTDAAGAASDAAKQGAEDAAADAAGDAVGDLLGN